MNAVGLSVRLVILLDVSVCMLRHQNTAKESCLISSIIKFFDAATLLKRSQCSSHLLCQSVSSHSSNLNSFIHALQCVKVQLKCIIIKFEYHGAYYIVYLVENWCNSHLNSLLALIATISCPMLLMLSYCLWQLDKPLMRPIHPCIYRFQMNKEAAVYSMVSQVPLVPSRWRSLVSTCSYIYI